MTSVGFVAFIAVSAGQSTATGVHRSDFSDSACTQYTDALDYTLGMCMPYSGVSDMLFGCDGSLVNMFRYEDDSCSGAGSNTSYPTGKCVQWNDKTWSLFACSADGSNIQMHSNRVTPKPKQLATISAVAGVHRSDFSDGGCTQYTDAMDYALGTCHPYSGNVSDMLFSCNGSSVNMFRYSDNEDCSGSGDSTTYPTGECVMWNDNTWSLFACASDGLNNQARATTGTPPRQRLAHIATVGVHRSDFSDSACTQYTDALDYTLGMCMPYSTVSDMLFGCDGSSVNMFRYDDNNCSGAGSNTSYPTGECVQWNDNTWSLFACSSDGSKNGMQPRKATPWHEQMLVV